MSVTRRCRRTCVFHPTQSSLQPRKRCELRAQAPEIAEWAQIRDAASVRDQRKRKPAQVASRQHSHGQQPSPAPASRGYARRSSWCDPALEIAIHCVRGTQLVHGCIWGIHRPPRPRADPALGFSVFLSSAYRISRRMVHQRRGCLSARLTRSEPRISFGLSHGSLTRDRKRSFNGVTKRTIAPQAPHMVKGARLADLPGHARI
jgi:hypothetical protein